MLKVIKHSAEFQKADRGNLIERNERVKNLLLKKDVIETKQLQTKHQQKI